MANLIITVISIALVAVAALMGAYFGGAAFLAGAAQADANRIIKQADQIQAAWSLHATYNGGVFQTIPLSDLTSGGKYLSQEPKPPEKISTESYSFIKLADNTATDGFDGIQLNLLTTDSARKACMAIARTAGSGSSAATPKQILSASDRTPTAGRKFDCLFSGTGSTPAVGDQMVFVYNVGAPSVAGGGGGGGSTATVTASPASLSFTTSTNTASAVQTVTVTNGGSTTATGLSASLSSGGTYFAFSTTCGSTLAASASCTASVNAKSTASAGSYSGNVAIASTNGGSQNVGLSVTVTAASADCTATGAGDSSYNGAYTQAGTYNGKPYYTNANGKLLFANDPYSYWTMGTTLITGPSAGSYYVSGGTTCPLGAWNVDNGINPAPTVN